MSIDQQYWTDALNYATELLPTRSGMRKKALLNAIEWFAESIKKDRKYPGI